MRRSTLLLASAATLLGLFAFCTPRPVAAEDTPAMAMPNPQMQAVLDALAALGAKPLHTLSVEVARMQPTPADAVTALMQERGIAPDPAVAAVKTADITIPGLAGTIAARVYTPEGDGPFPVVVYFHGGGWVIATLDTYDGSARALAAGTEAIVVSAHYRQAPENPFPAAHDDAFAAYQWVVEHAASFDGDTARIAVAGESAGANLATNVAIRARDEKVQAPLYQLLVYPVAGRDLNTPSYLENAESKPLGRADMQWFFDKVLADPADAADPRLHLVHRTDLAGLPPATVITAEIDPLRSEGQAYAAALDAAGVEVVSQNFTGVTHEFFGMGAVVDAAKQAMALATSNLAAALAK